MIRLYPKTHSEKLAPGLTIDEFDCKCSNESCRSTIVYWPTVEAFAKFREIVKTPCKINSGYRCQLHNASIGGAVMSRHLSGQALDIDVSGLLNKYTFAELVELLHKAGFTYTKSYQEARFIHADTRGK